MRCQTCQDEIRKNIDLCGRLSFLFDAISVLQTEEAITPATAESMQSALGWFGSLAREDDFKGTRINDLLESEEAAWGLIANAYGGNWELASKVSGWKAAAERWRDHYHDLTGSHGTPDALTTPRGESCKAAT